MSNWWTPLFHHLIRRKPEWLPSSLSPDGSDENIQVELLPLTATYEQEHHGDYFNAIEVALTEKNRQVIKNIALTGSYGVGKSSILQQVAQTHEENVVQISLSTLGVADDDHSPNAGASSKTNRIQKEIVKQLLYREDPDKTPGSRFRRIGQLSRWRGLGIAALASLALTVLFFLTGWTSQLAELVLPYWNPGLWSHLVLFTIFTLFVFALESAMHNRLRVKSLTTGYATVSLSGDNEMTYFDQYLDEIVYFFEVTKADIVIFEDIDRFDDPHIFETLRSLNSLINSAKQLNGRSIRFIYAIKDSIFDELGRDVSTKDHGDTSMLQDAAVIELVRANRTKFFDLVIPIVPFITHRSARDIMLRTMNEIERHISPELIDLAAQHLADMRLIKNTRNEFVIFRRHVLCKIDSVPGLTEDRLLAMILYKNTHLSDFEAIKTQQSNLDLLYADYRKLVADNLAHLDMELIHARHRITELDSVVTRGESLAAELLGYIERIARHLGVTDDSSRSITLASRPQSDSDLESADFWQAFIESDGVIHVSYTNRRQYQQAHTFAISRADASQALRDPLSIDEWRESDREQHQAQLVQLAKDRDFLVNADMSDLVKSEEFKVRLDSSEPASFAELVNLRLGSKLARQLVRAGYINRDFTLYSSTYYAERVSKEATTYLIHHVAPNIADAHFSLSPDDIEAILRERGESILRERGLYNIKVLDYLLETQDERSQILIESLLAYGEDEQSFLQTYLIGGREQESLVRELGNRWPHVIIFIISEAKIDEFMRLRLLNAVLENIRDEVAYKIDGQTRAYIEEHFAELPVFTSNATSAKDAELLVKLLTAMDARLSSLSTLGVNVMRNAIAASRYRITSDNLATAVGGAGRDLALDFIQDHDPVIFEYMLHNLAAYLDVLEETKGNTASIATVEAFGDIIEDALVHANALLPRVIAAAAPECRIARLVEVSEAAWPELAKQQRFPASLENVKVYIDSIGQIDDELAQLLKAAGRVTPSSQIEPPVKEAVALLLLAACELLPDPELRTKLVVGLELTAPLSASSIQSESSPLVGLMIDKGIVADDTASFALTLTADWPTREFAISKSKHFVSYMTPNEIPADDVAPLISSACISDRVKDELLSRVNEFVPTDHHKALAAIAEHADDHNYHLPIDLVTRMAAAQVNRHLLIRVLEPLLPDVSVNQLVGLLRTIGGIYADVAERNGKHPKLPNIEDHRSLVARLEELEVVSSHTTSHEGIVVHMKKA